MISTKVGSVILLFLLFYSLSFGQDVWVDPYFRSDGTFVRGHFRTRPNSTVLDNYSTWPNINPYTGKVGSRYKYSTLIKGVYYPSSLSNSDDFELELYRLYIESLYSMPYIREALLEEEKKGPSNWGFMLAYGRGFDFWLFYFDPNKSVHSDKDFIMFGIGKGMTSKLSIYSTYNSYYRRLEHLKDKDIDFGYIGIGYGWSFGIKEPRVTMQVGITLDWWMPWDDELENTYDYYGNSSDYVLFFKEGRDWSGFYPGLYICVGGISFRINSVGYWSIGFQLSGEVFSNDE